MEMLTSLTQSMAHLQAEVRSSKSMPVSPERRSQSRAGSPQSKHSHKTVTFKESPIVLTDSETDRILPDTYAHNPLHQRDQNPAVKLWDVKHGPPGITITRPGGGQPYDPQEYSPYGFQGTPLPSFRHCPLYTFDAADENRGVTISWRPIVKTKKP